MGLGLMMLVLGLMGNCFVVVWIWCGFGVLFGSRFVFVCLCLVFCVMLLTLVVWYLWILIVGFMVWLRL